MALSAKRQAFCREYVIDYNATAAAIRAGYSPKSAHNIAKELLKIECVTAEVERLKAEESRRTGVTKERIMRELARLAFVDPAAVMDNDGEYWSDAEEADRACVNRVKYRKFPDGSIEREVSISDKTKALELLGKMIGAFDGSQRANQVKLDGQAIRGLVILPDVEAEESPVEVVEDDEED